MKTKPKNRIGIVVPHIFIHRDIIGRVIFSPGKLAIDLCEELARQGNDVTLFSPGPVDTSVKTVTADLSYFEEELKGRGDTYIDLLKKHPFTFISLSRQVQAEIIAKAYEAANTDELDIVHVYTNEEDIALPFAKLCKKPVVFTHHDPFNFLVKYKNVFPKYKDLNWLSLSYAQRSGMPQTTNWTANIYHGLHINTLKPVENPKNNYVAYLGRIIEPKGLHLAIDAIKQYNETAFKPLKLKIAGKHYSEHQKDKYWKERIEPELSDTIEYVGHITTNAEKQTFLGNAKGLIVPSLFEEPFGMVTIEALACGTPVIGLPHGATSEIITTAKTGYVISASHEPQLINEIAQAIDKLDMIDRKDCRREFEARFTLTRMAEDHANAYQTLIERQAVL